MHHMPPFWLDWTKLCWDPTLWAFSSHAVCPNQLSIVLLVGQNCMCLAVWGSPFPQTECLQRSWEVFLPPMIPISTRILALFCQEIPRNLCFPLLLGGYCPREFHGIHQKISLWFCYMGVSKNRGTPKSSILIGFSILNHPFWGTIILGNTHMGII